MDTHLDRGPLPVTIGVDQGDSILAAIEQAVTQRGDHVSIRGGTYSDEIDSYLTEVIGGTSWATRLIIESYNGESVILKPPPSARNRVITLAHSNRYIEFRGLEFDGSLQDEYEVAKITDSGGNSLAHHLMFTDCVFHNGTISGLHLAGHDCFFTRCVFHHNGVTDFHHGVYCTNSSNQFVDCVTRDNAGWGFHLFNELADDVNGNSLLNCLAYDNATAGDRGSGFYVGSGTGTLIRDCRAWGQVYGLQIWEDALNLTVDRSQFFENDLGEIYLHPNTPSGLTMTDVYGAIVIGQ